MLLCFIHRPICLPRPLERDARFYSHHLDPGRRYDFGQSLAAVERHPSDRVRWGLRNLWAGNWFMTGPDGETRDVAPRRSTGLADGVRLGLGAVEGEITM